MAIDTDLLRKKIRKVEKEFGGDLSIDNATTLVKKIQRKYKHLQKKRFKSLVEQLVGEMGLGYNYCRLMFSYFGSHKKKKNGEREKHQRQMFFNFYNHYNQMVRY